MGGARDAAARGTGLRRGWPDAADNKKAPAQGCLSAAQRRSVLATRAHVVLCRFNLCNARFEDRDKLSGYIGG